MRIAHTPSQIPQRHLLAVAMKHVRDQARRKCYKRPDVPFFIIRNQCTNEMIRVTGDAVACVGF